jgi:hypothetical protein
MSFHETEVELVGGLGNQLFGYFAGLYFQELYGTTLTLNFSQIKTVGHLDSDLRHFKLVPHQAVESLNYNSKPRLTSRRIRDKILYHQPEFVRILNPLTLTIGDEFDLKKRLDSRARKLLLRGYFGSFEFFRHLRPSIRNLSLLSPSASYGRLLQEARQQQPIIVHIRRGDYVNHKNTYGLLSSRYYLNAIKIAESHVGPKMVWIFSDDLKEARTIKEELNLSARIIENEFKLNPAEALRIQSEGSANVVANSTFSAWGAALNSQSQIKICPSQYFFDGRDTPHWPPQDWISIEPDWI